MQQKISHCIIVVTVFLSLIVIGFTQSNYGKCVCHGKENQDSTSLLEEEISQISCTKKGQFDCRSQCLNKVMREVMNNGRKRLCERINQNADKVMETELGLYFQICDEMKATFSGLKTTIAC